MELTFIIYVIVTLGFLGSYVYFLLFQKGLHGLDRELDQIPMSFMLNRTSREWWTWMTKPVLDKLVALKIAPQTLGYVALGLSLIACIAYSFGSFVLGGWMVVFAGTCDFFDGRLARRLGLASHFGKFYDSNIDRWAEALWFLGLFNYYANTPFFYVVFAAFITSMMVSYAKARCEGLGLISRVGIMQRPERIAWLGISSILSPLFASLMNFYIPFSTTFLASMAITIIAIMGGVTYYQRFKDAKGRL